LPVRKVKKAGLLHLHTPQNASEALESNSIGLVLLGLCSEGAASYFLPRIAGPKGATERLAAGLINQLVEPGEALNLALHGAQTLAALPMASLILTKKLMKQDGAAKVMEVIDYGARQFSRTASLI
jgi:enoyl-CoA hydratase/carnithine racemase